MALSVCLKGAMAVVVEARPELVGKRFLCVSGEAPPELAEIVHWKWRVGVIRAVSHRDTDNPELTVRPRCALIITRYNSSHRIFIYLFVLETYFRFCAQRSGLVVVPVIVLVIVAEFIIICSHCVQKLSFFVRQTN